MSRQVTALGFLLFFTVFSGDVCSQDPVSNASNDEIISYDLGRRIGENLFSLGLDIRLEALMQGVQDSLDGKKTKFDTETANKAYAKISKEVNLRRAERHKAFSAAMEAKEAVFLEDNAKLKDVKVLANGIQYQMIAEGTGKPPRRNTFLEISYRSSYIDGREADSSDADGGRVNIPFDFAPVGVREVLLLMKEGGRARVVVPPQKESSSPRVVIWEIEVLKVIPSQAK